MTIKSRQSIPNMLKKVYMIIFGATIICAALAAGLYMVHDAFGIQGVLNIVMVSSFALFTWCMITYEPYTDVIVPDMEFDKQETDEIGRMKRKA